MTTKATLAKIATAFNVQIFGYKNINSPNDLCDWYAADGSFTPLRPQVLISPNNCGGHSPYHRMQRRGIQRDEAILKHIGEFLKANPVAEGHGLYITDSAWHAGANSNSQMAIALLLAPDSLHAFPPEGSDFWRSAKGKRQLSQKGVRVGYGVV